MSLAIYAEQLTEARDKAHRAADEAEQCIIENRQERASATARQDSVFAEIARDNSADKAREVALAEWAANAIALSGLHYATNGEHGQLYEDQPSPFRRKTNGAEVPVSPQGVKR